MRLRLYTILRRLPEGRRCRKMPIRISPKQVTPRKKVTLSIQEPIWQKVELYARYLGGKTDTTYVVEQILQAFFDQEKDFKRWLDGQQQLPTGT